MTITTFNGYDYKDKYGDEIKAAINEFIDEWNPRHMDDISEKDFCIFIRMNGYMIMLKDRYNKLSKVKKKTIERSYEYRHIPE